MQAGIINPVYQSNDGVSVSPSWTYQGAPSWVGNMAAGNACRRSQPFDVR